MMFSAVDYACKYPTSTLFHISLRFAVSHRHGTDPSKHDLSLFPRAKGYDQMIKHWESAHGSAWNKVIAADESGTYPCYTVYLYVLHKIGFAGLKRLAESI